MSGIHVELARHLRDGAAEAWGKPLTMNVSMPIAAVMLDLGFPSATVKAVPILARTAGLLAHLAEEQQAAARLPDGRARGGGDRVRAPTGGRTQLILAPEVETRPWEEQLAVDDASYARPARLPLRALGLLSRQARGGRVARRLAEAGGLAQIAQLPLTEKRELRDTCTPDNPIGAHLCAAPAEIVRIYSTSGTTGAPSYIPLTAGDLDNWVTGSARSYAASGIEAGQRVVTTYNAGPFVAGAALASFDRIGLTHIPVGTGNTERLIRAIELLRPEAAVLTPSYAAHLVEWAAERSFDLRGSSVRRVLVAGEPGGGEPAFRAALEEGWGARVTEAMGIGDIGVSLWGECEEQDGMHLGARGFVHAELIEPGTGAALALDDGATGELVLTHLRHRAAPLLRFRTRDHVQVRTSPCRCGRTEPAPALHRPYRRHADRPRRERLPLGHTRGGERLRPRRERPHPRQAERGRREAGAAAPGERRAGAGPRRAATRSPRRSARDCGLRWSSRRAWSSCRGAAFSAANTSRSSSSTSQGREPMQKLQSQGVHHITIVGAARQTSIDFWEGVLGMPFVFEQPNLDNESESHLYFDPGDGRLITIFTNEEREADPGRTPTDPGCVHHLAFAVSQATFHQAVERLDERGIKHSGVKDRGFMDSIYFEDPLGLLIELASYRFEPPAGHTHADVLLEAHKLRVERGDYNIAREHLADAIEALVTRSRESLSDDRSPKDPYK